jgi:MFS family permease
VLTMHAVYETQKEIPISASWKRTVGASFFGLISAAYVQNAASRTIPAIMSLAQQIDLESAETHYESSDLIRSCVFIVTAFIGALTAGFLARRRGMLVGFLTNSPYVALLGYILFVSLAAGLSGTVIQSPLAEHLQGDTMYKLGIVLRFAFLLIASLTGGLLGQRLYAPEIDPDFGQEKLTIFGVRWPHYFWILPFIYLAFLASIIIIVYAAIVVLIADCSYAWHPSLWLSVVWWIFFPLGPFLVYLAAAMTSAAFIRFYEVMQYRQTRFRGWKKVGRVLLYGVGAPALSDTIAALGADVAHAMPKPVQGDWKIAVGFMALIYVIGITRSIHSWVTRTRSGGSRFAP